MSNKFQFQLLLVAQRLKAIDQLPGVTDDITVSNFHFHLSAFELGEIEDVLVFGDWDVAELGAGAFGEELPRNDVAVVLHLGEQDLVARLDVLVRRDDDVLRIAVGDLDRNAFEFSKERLVAVAMAIVLIFVIMVIVVRMRMIAIFIVIRGSTRRCRSRRAGRP